MDNNLRRIEKDLRAVAKRCKSVTYSTALLFIFLMLGILVYATQLEVIEKDIEKMEDDIHSSMHDLRRGIELMRRENYNGARTAQLEFTQLIEQGNQVVKSPWESWQFGVNTFVTASNGTYKGKGNKSSKYNYENMYLRGDWSQRSTMITSDRTRKQVLGDDSLIYSTYNTYDYGLVPLQVIQEPEVELQIMASVRPKSIVKEALSINPQITLPAEVKRPEVNPKLPVPLEATEIRLPSVTPVNIVVPTITAPAEPTTVVAPVIGINLPSPVISVNVPEPQVSVSITPPTVSVENININPSKPEKLEALTVTPPEAVAVIPPNPTITAVSFAVPKLVSFGNSVEGYNSMNGNPVILSGHHVLDSKIAVNKQNAIAEYMGGGDLAATKANLVPSYFSVDESAVLDVKLENRRALALDGGLPSKYRFGLIDMNYDYGGRSGSKAPDGTITYGVDMTVENKGTINLMASKTGAMEIQPDGWDYLRVTALNTGTIVGQVGKTGQAAMLLSDENTGGSKQNTLVLHNNGTIQMDSSESAAMASGNFGTPINAENIEAVLINDKNITLNGDRNHGMVIVKTTNKLIADSRAINTTTGVININGNESGGITLLDKLPGGAKNEGNINITGDNSFGLYSEVDSNIENAGTITIQNGATKSMGIRVGNPNATNMKNTSIININSADGDNIGVYSGTATFENEGIINVNGNKNIGMFFNQVPTSATDTNKNLNTINVDGTNGFGVMLKNTKFENEKDIIATGTNSMGLYMENNSEAINKSNGKITSNSHAVVQITGNFVNEGEITTNGGGKVALYSQNGTFAHNSGTINANNGGIAIYNNNSTGTVKSTINVGNSTPTHTGIGVYSTGTGTTTFDTTNAKLVIGEKAVGLYSADASKFSDTFVINNLKASIGKSGVFAYFDSNSGSGTPTEDITNTILNNLIIEKMDEKSSVFYGASGTTLNIADDINTTTAGKFSNIHDTAQFLVTSGTGAIANINAGKTVTSNMKTTISGLDNATVNNDGTLVLTGKDGAVGIYLDNATANNNEIITTANKGSVGIYGSNNSKLNNIDRITTSGEESVGMFAETSEATNTATGVITLENKGSAGVYGANNSKVENSGLITVKEVGSAGLYADNSKATNTTTGTITTEKGTSAGIYAKSTSAKDISNAGTINIGTTASAVTEEKGIGIYADLIGGTGVLNVSNSGDINVNLKNSTGIYAKNSVNDVVTDVNVTNTKNITTEKEGSVGIYTQKATATNELTTGKIIVKGEKSAGIYGKEKSNITNAGLIEAQNTSATSESVGIYVDDSTATNTGTIAMKGGASAGIVGINKATITNDSTGIITMEGKSSAGIYTENSTATNNSGAKIEVKGTESAGMYAKNSGTDSFVIENKGEIKLFSATGTEKSAGMYAEIEGGTTGITTLKNSQTTGKIVIDQKNSAGIYVKNNTNNANTIGIAENSGIIEGKADGNVGIYVQKAQATNEATGTITMEGKSSAGIYGVQDSVITNKNIILIKNTASAGMNAQNSESKNEGTGTITVEKGGSAGMLSNLTTTATKDYSATNLGTINLTAAAPEEKSAGIYGKTDAGVTKVLTLKNDGDVNISIENSVGILGENDTANDVNKLVIQNNNNITGNSQGNIGILAKKSTVTNNGTIVMNGKGSAGISAEDNSVVTNTTAGTITTKEESSAGISLKNSNAVNNGNIIVENKASAGIYGDFTGTSTNTIDNYGTISVTGLTPKEKSAGIYGKSSSIGNVTITNKATTGIINVDMEESAGIYVEKVAGTTGTLTANNENIINANSEKSVGILAQNAIGNNKKTINVNGVESVGMLAENGATVLNEGTGTINVAATGTKASGIYVKGNTTTGTNEGEIILNAQSNGMVASNSGTIINKKNITGKVQNVIGMYGVDSGTNVINDTAGIITLEKANSTGLFTKDDALGKNKGTINIKDGASAGMFGLSSQNGKKIDLENTGTINVDKEGSVAIFTSNVSDGATPPTYSGNVADSVVKNTGTINLNDKGTVGIYTPASTVTTVGNITMGSKADSTVGVYLTQGTKVDVSTGNIDLNNTSQQQVAYYVKGNGQLTGANIGTISGYGVGVFLEDASLNTTAVLDYTTGTNSGDGIIGVYMKGNSDLSTYTNTIKVGSTVGDKSAVGIYALNQGTAGAPKVINTGVTTGVNGIGLFAQDGSNIKYGGTMSIGDGANSGTGIYIGNNATPSTVTIDGAYITLDGKNGLGAYVTTGSTVNYQANSTIELKGAGVGIFGESGAIIHDNGGAFVTNGHSAERIRLTEGQIVIGGNLTLNTGNVLAHVINGEAVIDTGVTVDAAPSSNSIIGIMAEGNKNPVAPGVIVWVDPNYEAVNNGTLDLSNATKSTGIYVDAARGINNGTLKVGDTSTAMYGIHKYTGKYKGATTDNVSELTNTSTITIGNSSAAMYGIAVDKIQNTGTITGGTETVGIYATDVDTSGNYVRTPNTNLDVLNTGTITLGNASSGIFVNQTDMTKKAVVNHSGKIVVGDSTINPTTGDVDKTAVGIYTQNANVTTTGDIKVGNRGIAIYGANSKIDVNAGNIDYSNNGILSYLENSTLNYNIAGTTLTTSSQPLLFINNSNVAMSNNDINVSPNGVGAYVTGNSTFTGWNTITLGTNSTGIYSKDATVTTSGSSITSTDVKAKGIVLLNSNLANNTANINLSGDESLGIYSNNTDPAGLARTLTNNGNIDIAGKKSVGVYLEGTAPQAFTNNGTLNVAATTDTNKNNSTVGIYAKNGSTIDITNNGTINVANKSVGIYSLSDGYVNTGSSSVLNVADEAIGIYKETGTMNLAGTINVAPHTATTPNSEPAGVYASNGVTIVDSANYNVGDKSYGVILNNTTANANNYTNSSSSNISLGSDTTFIYSDGLANVINNGNVTTTGGDRIIAFYAKNGGNFENNGTIDLSSGLGNLGMYSTGVGSYVRNNTSGKIYVGGTDTSDPTNVIYGIGMAAQNGGKAINTGDIYIKENLGIGMYGSGVGTEVLNDGNIYLDASGATATNRVENMVGVFVDHKAVFVNRGNIKTVGSYAGNPNVRGLVGVAVLNGGTLENYGNIEIDADKSYGVLIKGTDTNKSIIKNYGNITISGSSSYGVRYANTIGEDGSVLPTTSATAAGLNVVDMINGPTGTITSTNGAEDYYIAKPLDKAIGGVSIVTLPSGTLQIQRNGVAIDPSDVTVLNYPVSSNISFSNFGVYVDTLGRTNPINLHGVTTLNPTSDLIIGTEFSEITNARNVVVGQQILQPFLNQISAGIFDFKPYSGSLTWIATPQVDPVTQQITNITMAKIPYTAFVARTDNAWNFTDGLEQRYDMNALDSREKALFNKLNSIGNNENAVLAQAYDEMMGHQYANIQHRVHSASKMLDKELTHIKNEWETKSKDSNKLKIFGMRDNYSTDTAGIIDYTSNAYGFAYLHEDETVQLGRTTGWYAGAINNNFNFKDIGGSKENQTMLKLGIFKSTPYDYNNSLNWTISGEIFGTINEMNRKFLVVDDIFEANSNYYTYGAAVKNEVSKSFRTSETTFIKPYGSLKLEYGRFNDIKEKDGQVRLEVKGNDYFSIRPEIGVEFKYRKPFGRRSVFLTTATVAYENELGRIGDPKNKARVGYTTADWFNLEGEKENRRGNIKADWNLGIENSRVGFTFNLGYDTNGSNLRGGLGVRAIY